MMKNEFQCNHCKKIWKSSDSSIANAIVHVYIHVETEKPSDDSDDPECEVHTIELHFCSIKCYDQALKPECKI